MIVESAPKRKDRSDEQPPLFPDQQKISPIKEVDLDELAEAGRRAGKERESEQKEEDTPYWQK